LIVFLLAIIVLASGCWLWHGIYPPSPRFNSTLISVNHEPQKILSGETFAFHASDKVKILKVSTNILLNLNVRMVAEDFDVNALRHEEMRLSGLLPGQNIFDHYKFRVRIKYRNQDLGHMDWEIQPYAEDWLDKAANTTNDDQRLATLERGLRLLPEDSHIWRRLLDEYKSQKLWKKAVLMLEEMAGKNLDREILIELLEVYTAMSKKDKTVSVLKKLVELDPEDLNLKNRLAEVLEERGKWKAAIKEYEAILKRSDIKNSLPIYKRLGYLYTETGQYEKAISFYLKAAKSDKKDANLYYNLSYLYEKIHQKEKADSCLARAVSLKSGDVESRLELAQRMFDKGDLKKAEKYLSEVLKKKPASLKALLMMAKLMETRGEKRGEKQELKKIYKKILSLAPDNETVMYNLGVLHYETGDLKSALTHFKKYVKLNPKDVTAHEFIFDVCKKQKNNQMAFKEAQILVKLKPKKIDLYHFMFDYLKSRGDYDEIVRVMEKGVKANPKQTDLGEYLLFAYLKTGKETLAVKQMGELLKTRPKNVELLLHMARLLEKHENYAGALVAYKKIIDISSDHEEAEEAYLRLRLKGVQSDK